MVHPDDGPDATQEQQLTASTAPGGAEPEPESTSGAPAWARTLGRRLDDAATRKREKVTASDVEARWKERERSVDPVRRQRRVTRMEAVLAGALVVGSVGVWAVSSHSHASARSAVSSSHSATNDLHAQAKSVESSRKKIPTVVSGQKILAELQKKGKRVATLQNDYKSANLHDNAVTKISNELDFYFTDSTSDAHIPWYTILTDKTNPYAKTKYSWTFEPPYTFNKSGTTVNVAWTCTDSKNRLLAFAVGEYDVKSKKFIGMAWDTTNVGQSLTGSSQYNKSEGKNS